MFDKTGYACQLAWILALLGGSNLYKLGGRVVYEHYLQNTDCRAPETPTMRVRDAGNAHEGPRKVKTTRRLRL